VASDQCKKCDGDGYCERLSEDLEYTAWLCTDCDGTGRASLIDLPGDSHRGK
jgi:DnaJ-class molecular chaperone